MSMTGMDIQQVRDLANTMRVEADNIINAINNVTTKVESAEWKGQDRETFLNEWNSVDKPSLQTAHDKLVEAADAADRNANEQDRTSNEY